MNVALHGMNFLKLWNAAPAWVACLPCVNGAPLKVKAVIVTMFEVGADAGDVPDEFQLW